MRGENFYIGDRVTVCDLDTIRAEFGQPFDDHFIGCFTLSGGMDQYCGQTFMVTNKKPMNAYGCKWVYGLDIPSNPHLHWFEYMFTHAEHYSDQDQSFREAWSSILYSSQERKNEKNRVSHRRSCAHSYAGRSGGEIYRFRRKNKAPLE